jgi:acyl-CoA reductase-like NAD-dependent aldehyde dehydrogenase
MQEFETPANAIRETLSVNPATGEILGTVRENTPEDLREAVFKARKAQELWAATSYSVRAHHVMKIRSFVVDQTDRIVETISKDTGKTRFDALSTEVIPSTMCSTWYARNAEKVLGRARLKPGNILFSNKRSYVDRIPYGVVGIITPWNYPFSIPFHEYIMALMAGNGVVAKVATKTQQVAKLLEEVIRAGNLPEGLFTMINVPGPAAGEAFIESGIDKLFYTGSVPVAKKLMANASERLLPVCLELGGNDAMIVCNDANIHRAVGGALWAGFSNAGQSCAGVERIYVEEGIYDEFAALLRRRVRSLRMGPDTDGDIDIGAMTTAQQLKTVTEHVTDAIEKGALITAVSEHVTPHPAGLFYPPTVLEEVHDDMLTMQLETFGPVVAIMKVGSIVEAIDRANNSTLGLTASVWTRDRMKAHAIASRLRVGTVTINDHLMSHGLPETPWGGFKQSGIGRTHGALGLYEMTQARVVVDDVLPGVQKNIWWYPHSRSLYTGMKSLVDLLYAKRIGKRILGIPRFLLVALRTFRR